MLYVLMRELLRVGRVVPSRVLICYRHIRLSPRIAV
jgi:hypothetical protein